MARRTVEHELNRWLRRNGYSERSHTRMIHQAPTGRPVFAAHERDHHITTTGRRALRRAQFALPPGPEEKRRGIKGRLPIDTIQRARSALARASMMRHQGHLTARQLEGARRAVHKAWPSIELD
jgi:ribosomal protein L16/L10AE